MNRILQFLSSISLFIKRVTGFSHILFTAFFVLSILPLWGQGGNYPVQVIPQALPPAPIYISNYADASTVSSPLRVQIILNDFEIANREIRLKTYVVGSGLNFESNDLVIGASPLFLEGGVPLVLTNVDLAPYFQYENISGISPNVYGQPIPEGAYQFCFEVYDVLTGNRLSNRSCAVSVVFQNEPPFLVSPRNNTNVDEVNPQYIVFQWTPRSINVSNVEYELSLVEIWDNQVDPQQAFLSSPPIFQATTTSPTYVYGPSDPLLLSGKNYAWRVQAKARQGTEELGLFKNDGYSEIFSFSYASACELPLGINHEVKGSTNANIFWDDFSTEIPEYTVRYREKNGSTGAEDENEWFFLKTTTNQLTLWDLKAGGTYEYQLQNACSVTESQWSTTKEFTTFILDNEESVYDCNITPDFDISNQDPLPSISTGEQFIAGDFPINITEVNGSNGRFNGKGYVTIPYLSSMKASVEFTNILLNTDKKLIEGTVKTTYDPSLKNILDIDEAIDTVENIVDSVGEFFEGDTDRDEITVNWAITKDDIKVEDGYVIITNPNTGATKTEPLGDDMAITDSAGNTFYVTEDGEITEGGQVDDHGSVNGSSVTGVSNNGQIESLTAPGIKVTFNTKGTYGIDRMPTGTSLGNIPQEYTVIKDATGTDYPLTHHAVKLQDNTTIVGAISIQNSDYDAEDLIFKNKIGEIIPRTIEGDSVSISLSGRHTFENETIYALVESKVDSTKQLTAGAFTLWHLTERNIDVAIVSVEASLGDVETTVQNIFKTGVANINFKPRISLNVEDVASALGTNGMDIGDSPFTAAYNAEQKALKNLAKAAGANDPNTYYIIVLGDDFLNTKQIAGFMPLQRQYGFVFEKYTGSGELTNNQEAKGTIAKTLAHEIGHGVFALQHPFTEYGSSENATDWLMDYSNGDNLPHTHWAQIHNPDLKFYIFQDEEDGEHYTLNGKFNRLNFGKNDDGTFTFLTPSAKSIILPNDVGEVTTFYGYSGNSFLNNEDNFTKFMAIVPGTIKSFKINDKTYEAVITKSGDEYILKGYFNDEKEYSSSNTVVQPNEQNSEHAIFFAVANNDNQIGYNAIKIGTSSYSQYQTNQLIINPSLFPYDYTDVLEKKSIDVNSAGLQNSYNRAELPYIFSNNYEVSDNTLLLRNKLLEFKTAYSRFIKEYAGNNKDNLPVIWSLCSDYSQPESANTAGFEIDLRKEFCECENPVPYTQTGPNQPTATVSCEINNSSLVQVPSDTRSWLTLFYSYLKENAINLNEEIFTSITDYNISSPDKVAEDSISNIARVINLASPNDIGSLSTDAILRLISRILNESAVLESSLSSADLEGAIIKLIQYSHVTNARSLIEGLESYNSYDEDETEYLYEQMFWAVDDANGLDLFGLTSNNRNDLILECTKLVFKDMDFYNERLHIAIDSIEKRAFIFEYNNFLKNLGLTITNASSSFQIADLISNNAISGELENQGIEFEFQDTGKIYLAQTKELGFFDSDEIFNTSPEDLRPFDLVIFINKSNVSLVREYLSGINGGDLPIPAIAVAYVSQAGNNETVQQGISTTLDIVGLVGTGGTLNALTGVNRMRKILLTADILSSSLALTSTALSDDPTYDDLRQSMDLLSTVLGIAALGENFIPKDIPMRQGLKQIKDAVDANGNYTLPTVQEVENVFNAIDNLDDTKLAKLIDDHPENVRDLELLLAKRYKDALDAGNAEDLDEALGLLEKIKDARALNNSGSVAEGLINGLRRYRVAEEFANGETTVTRFIEYNGNTIELKWTLDVNGNVDFGSRSNLRTLLGTTEDEAHHILTWTKSGENEVVQAAALDGFHLNMLENGVGLEKYRADFDTGLHGNHPKYDDYVVHRLFEFKRDFPDYTPESANRFIQEELIPDLNVFIELAGDSDLNLNLNEYFKQIVNPSIGDLLTN